MPRSVEYVRGELVHKILENYVSVGIRGKEAGILDNQTSRYW